MATLTSVEQAIEHILLHAVPLPEERVPLDTALNRVLACDITADTDLPPFACSSMDGFAVRSEDTATAPTQLRVVLDIPAGFAPMGGISSGQAARIMTGAPLPPGADAVVPVEQTDAAWMAGESASLPLHVTIAQPALAGANVRQPGEDVRKGQLILPAGRRLRPADIGMLAALGQANAPVTRRPLVTVISTGDELLEVNEALRPGAVRDANRYMIAALVEAAGGIALRLPIARDTLESVRDVFAQALAAAPDVIVSSAGVSVGMADVVRTVLAELGEVSLWRVNVRPGKPLAFGRLRGVPFFGLPGNPVSAAVTFDVFVRPFLARLQRRSVSPALVKAITVEDIQSDGRRSYLRVKLFYQDGRLCARTTGTQSSGALFSLVLADGLLIVPEGMRFVPAGSAMDVRPLGDVEITVSGN